MPNGEQEIVEALDQARMLEMHFGFTGTREGMTDLQSLQLRRQLLFGRRFFGGTVVFHHGDCIGADKEAAWLAHALGFIIVSHPPKDDQCRAFAPADIVEPEKDYLVRNRDIVNVSDFMLATPKEMTEQQRGGTWYTWRYTKRTKTEGILILPDGSLLFSIAETKEEDDDS